MKKRCLPNVAQSETGAVHSAAIETTVLQALPNLVKHMCVTRYDDGLPRRPGWVTVKTYGAAWVIQVKDPDSCLSLTVTQQSLDDAMALADVLLGSDDAPWEPDSFLMPKKGRAVAKRPD